MYRNSLRGALLASTAFVMFGSGPALAQAGGSCTTVDGAQVCEGDQPAVNAYSFGNVSFANTGTLHSTFIYLYNGAAPFNFLNTESGAIIANGFAIPAVTISGANSFDGPDVGSFVNLGVIASITGPAVFTRDSVEIGSFVNSGLIVAAGEGHTPGGCFFAEDYAIEIQGRITGDFVNTGIIGATDTAVHVAAIDGSFVNDGQIVVIGGEEFGDTAVRLGTLGGDFINQVDGEIAGYFDAVYVTEIAGDFVNYGSISGEAEAIHIGRLGGDFVNFGTIQSTTDFEYGASWIGFLDGGFYNGDTGLILSEDHGLWIEGMFGSAVVNEGLISARYDAVTIGYSGSSYVFSNAGGILSSEGSGVTIGRGFGPAADGQEPGEIGMHVPEGGVTFINDGTITGASFGVSISNSVLSFENNGLIDGGFIGVSLGGNTGAFSNTGDIIGGYAGVTLNFLSGDFVNTGLIEAVRETGFDRQAPNTGDSIPSRSNGIGVSGFSIVGDFINFGAIRGSATGVSIYSLGGNFINEGLIESTPAPETAELSIRGRENSPGYVGYALDIEMLGGVPEVPFNAGGGTAIGPEQLSFYNSEIGEIIGVAGGIRIGTLMGPAFYNAGLISSVADAVTIERGTTNYDFINYGNIVSSDGDGVSLGNFSGGPPADPLTLVSARGGEFSPAGEIGFFFNGGLIAAGGTGVDIAHDMNLFENQGVISGGQYGVRLAGSVATFTNLGTITASGGGMPPAPAQEPDTLAAPALRASTLGYGVWLDYLTGDFLNGPDASITGSFRGVNAYLVLEDFVNYGSISGGEQGVQIYSLGGNFINDGLIEQTAASEHPDAAAVLLVNVYGDDGFYNSTDGEIRAENTGVSVIQFMGGNFLNDGLISAGGDGVVVSFVGGERAFENNGEIVSSDGAGVLLSHYPGGGCGIAPLGSISTSCAGNPLGANPEVTDLTFLNTGTIFSSVLGVRIEGLVSLFENRGAITGGKVGVDLIGDVETLTNYGAITGDQTGIRFNDNIGFLYNAGSITGLTGGDSEIGAGLRVYGDAGTYLMNATDGAITGFTAVALGEGDDYLINAGILTGTGGVAASLGGGDDVFVSHGIGSISGAVDGGADHDVFYASGTQTLDMAIDNFEEMWLIGGDITFGRDQSADFMVSAGNSLDLAEFTFTGDFLSAADVYANGGSVDGDVVNFGRILALDLTVTGDLYNGGVINPGGSDQIGTLTVLGDFYALNIGDPVDLPGGGAPSPAAASVSPSSSTLVFNFNGINHDQIVVTGAATLGGDLVVTGNLGAAMTARQDFTLISAASMSGGFNLLNIGGVLFTPQIDKVGADLLLSFAQNNFVAALAPASRNQSQAASGLEDRWNLGASAADDVILALNAGAESAPILQAYSPETSAALTRQSARIGTQLAQTVANCAIGPNAGACGQRDSEGGVMIWTNVSASEAALKADGNGAGVDEAFSQVSSGAEYAFGDQFAAGLFLAAGTGDVDIANGLRGHGEIDSIAGGLYARMQAGRFTLAGLAGYADTDIEARRATPLGASIGETGGSVSFARLDARLTLVSGVSQAGFAMSGTYAYAEIGNFAQRGAGAYDLDIVGDSFRVEDWELRGFFDHSFDPSQSGLMWSFGATAGVVHANGEDTSSVAARFPGGTAPYEALGPRSNDTGGVASGYIDLASPLAGVNAQLGVEGRWMDGEDSSRVYGRFSWRF
tara:strand:- start:4097 stop:9196 length:5100 start_codon:yes stop_codon:yes gene_type:complete